MATKATVDKAFSYWQTLIDNFQISPLQFYQAVETHLRNRQVPETRNARVDYQEGGLLSANREYLHITREKLAFDICGAPFGTSFFVSWWLSETKPHLAGPLKALILLAMLVLAPAAVEQIGLLWSVALIALLVPAVLYVVHDMTVDGTLNDDFIRVLPVIGPLYEWLFKPNIRITGSHDGDVSDGGAPRRVRRDRRTDASERAARALRSGTQTHSAGVL